FWVGMLAPSKTPKPVLDKLNAEVVKILNSTEFKTKLDSIGAAPMAMTSIAAAWRRSSTRASHGSCCAGTPSR
ncbi:MAG: hypothetical protein EBT83_15410, partial [Betaproteobacteria bacterium]|nr:hypothetical protein [Betaproteobacteria bacterium]